MCKQRETFAPVRACMYLIAYICKSILFNFPCSRNTIEKRCFKEYILSIQRNVSETYRHIIPIANTIAEVGYCKKLSLYLQSLVKKIVHSQAIKYLRRPKNQVAYCTPVVESTCMFSQ